MHKDELLDLHEQMVQIKDQFLAFDSVDQDAFAAYEELDVDPRTSTSPRANTNTPSSCSATRWQRR